MLDRSPFQPAPLLLAIGTLLLGACGDSTQTPSASPPTASPTEQALASAAEARFACDASKAEWALGRKVDDALREKARIDAGARIARTLSPGQMVTMEHNDERLNLDIDLDSIVVKLRCG